MKNIFLTLLFISFVSFAFANNIKANTIKDDAKQIELTKIATPNPVTTQTEKAVKTEVSKPNVRFTCAYEAEDGTVYITEGWGLTGPAAMRSCQRRLARML